MGSLTYVGHSTVLVEQGGLRLLTDPLLRAGIAHVRRRVPMPELDALRELDAVLISHAHADHLDLASPRLLAHLARSSRRAAPRRILRKAGMRDVVELPRRPCTIGDGGARAVAGRPRRTPSPLGIGHARARVPRRDGAVRVYFAGDTDLFDGMGTLADGRRGGAADLGLGAAAPGRPPEPGGGGPTPPRSIGPPWAVPIHWGTLRSVGTRDAARAPGRRHGRSPRP